MNVLELAERRVRLKRVSSHKGGEYQGPCPGCGDLSKPDSNRFHVWPEQNDGKGSYWCRGCGKSGDNIQFLRDFEGLSFHEACERLGQPVPEKPSLSRPRMSAQHKAEWQPSKYEEPSELWQQKAWKFVTWCYERLFEFPEAMQHLKDRGITTETMAAFGLGWNPGEKGGPLYRDRESWGLSPIKNSMGKAKPLWLPVGHTIPYFITDKLVRVKIRQPKPLKFGPPYPFVEGSMAAPMMLSSEMDVFVVTEAELDAILVIQEAGDMAGALGLGSVSVRPDERAAKVLKQASFILLTLDFDGAGKKEAAWWQKHFPQCEIWPTPRGKDPGEAYQAGVNIREWIVEGLPPALKWRIGG